MKPVRDEFLRLRPGGGFRCILADVPWSFDNYSAKGEEKNAKSHYECQDLDWICALPVQILAADDCALFMWCTWPLMPVWTKVLDAWGFSYAGLAWEWIKFNPETGKYALGCGYGSRKNLEPCILATRGSPSLRKDASFFGSTTEAKSHSVRDFIEWHPGDCIRSARREHSRKPEQQFERIEAMFDPPYIELFARERRKNWSSWGDQQGRFG